MDKYINWAAWRDRDTSGTMAFKVRESQGNKPLRFMKSTFLRVVTPYISVQVYRRFGDIYRFYVINKKVTQRKKLAKNRHKSSRKLLQQRHNPEACTLHVQLCDSVCIWYVCSLFNDGQSTEGVSESSETNKKHEWGSRKVFKDNHSAVCMTWVACRAVAMQRPRRGVYTRSVSGQRFGKHVPVARQQIVNNSILGLKQMKELCFLCVPRRDVSG
jgi:hypothetical protein